MKERWFLALVTDAFGGHGGIALYMRDVLRCLDQQGDFDRIELLARTGDPEAENVPDSIHWNRIALAGKIAFLKGLLSLLTRINPPEFILCGHINLIPLARLAANRWKVPAVLFIYGIDAWKPPTSRWVRKSIESTDLVVSISETTRARFLSWSNFDSNRTILLPNAIRQERYGLGDKNPALIDRYGLQDKVVLMTLGRLSTVQRHKGIDEVLHVLPELLVDYPNLVYLVAGGGDDIDRLQALARKLGVSQHVVFTGMVDENEKADHYRLADAFALTGHGDGFGFVLLEAMACGIPVVASSLDGSQEAVKSGELGLVTNPQDQEALLQALSESLQREKQIPKGLSHFSIHNFCNRLQTALNVLSASHS